MLKLKELLKKRKIKQKELGQMLNLSESTISLYIAGKREPDIETLKKLADFFHVSADYLMGIEDNTSLSDRNSQQPENTVRIVGRGGVIKEFKVTDKERKMFERMLEAEDDDPELKF